MATARSISGMEPFPVDIDPTQIVRWIIAEHRVTPSSLKIMARRTTEVRQIPDREELHLGDEEREDLSEVATVASLEIAPADPSDGWRMTVVVEDEVRPGVPDRGTMVEEDQQIDLETFKTSRLILKPSTASSFARGEEPRLSSRRQTMPRPRPVYLAFSLPSRAIVTAPVLASKERVRYGRCSPPQEQRIGAGLTHIKPRRKRHQ